MVQGRYNRRLKNFPFLPVEFPVMMIPSDLKNFAAFAVSTMLTSDVTLWAECFFFMSQNTETFSAPICLRYRSKGPAHLQEKIFKLDWYSCPVVHSRICHRFRMGKCCYFHGKQQYFDPNPRQDDDLKVIKDTILGHGVKRNYIKGQKTWNSEHEQKPF